MSEEMQPATTEAQADRPPHVSDIIATADQPLLPAGAMDTCPQEVCVQSSNLRAAESENIGNLQGNESDPIELELVACRSEFVTADAAGGVGVFPLNGSSVGGVGVDVAAEFAS